jgi:hypothetical protein
MRYELKNVMISSYNTSGASASDEPPTVNLTIAYTPIEVSYSRDELDFKAGDDGSEGPNFQMLEIKRPPKPPSEVLPDTVDELVFLKSGDAPSGMADLGIETQDPVPLVGLLLPAVQAVYAIDEAETNVPIWDDFMLA